MAVGAKKMGLIVVIVTFCSALVVSANLYFHFLAADTLLSLAVLSINMLGIMLVLIDYRTNQPR